MIPIAVVAASAESALGSGADAYRVPRVGERPTVAIRRDPLLVSEGLRRPLAARAAALSDLRAGAERADVLLHKTGADLARQLDARLPGWRGRKIGVVVGTSSGGMLSLVQVLSKRSAREPLSAALARRAPYFGPLRALDEVLGIRPRDRVQVLAACASAAYAIGLGCRWLESERLDMVVAGGYDAISPFVAAGFETIGATARADVLPFQAAREGTALGEGAALLALARVGVQQDGVLGYLLGFGASGDAVHITAPDRSGRGLAKAACLALEDARLDPSSIGLVSAHGTATRYNDLSEAKALHGSLGMRAAEVAVHPFKADIGHTLGAGAALETLAALDALRHEICPAAGRPGPLDPEIALHLPVESSFSAAKYCLKLSAAFGGANAALVLGSESQPRPPRQARPVFLRSVGSRVGSMDLDAVAPLSRAGRKPLARLDPYSALVVAATATALRGVDTALSERTGIVVGSATTTLESNERFHRRLRDRGPSGAEPRRFTATSPNLAAGQCAIAFGWTGPCLAVGAGLAAAVEALLVGHDLVASGDVEAVVVVAAEHVEHVVQDLWQAANWPAPAHGAVAAILGSIGRRAVDRGCLRRAQSQMEENLGVLGSDPPGWCAFLGALSAALS